MRQLKISSDRLTNRTDNISRYFSEVSNRPMLSSEEEFKVGVLAQQGDEEAIEKLISSNLRFVVSVAKQYASTGVLLEDLICQGNIGLCDAARSFDPTRGFKFISYAVWHIRKEILVYLNSDHRTIRIPVNVINDLNKIRRADEQIMQDEERPGTPEELQEMLSKMGKDYSVDHIKKVASAESRGIPLESNDPEETLSPIDWLSGESSAADLTDLTDLSETVRVALSKLNFMQRDVVVRRLGLNGKEPENFSSIAERYDRTPEWARSLYIRCLKLMQVRLKNSKITRDKILNHEI